MSGAAFGARGASTGQAPTTSFFGTVPDKYTMLMRGYSYNLNDGTGSHVQYLTTKFPAININTWVPWDDMWAASGSSHITASIGSTTTAPDGTATGFHVTEGTNTGYHVMVAGCDDNGLRVPARRRLAVFAKAAERTRCWLFVGEFLGLSGTPNNNWEAGVRCVFDLAGGQIAVPVAANNTGPFPLNFSAVGAGMIPFGNGWYLCYIDVSLATNAFANPVPFATKVLQSVFGPDSGSGTGAISNSYVGNGTSGVYAWNTNMLPPRAYGMNNVTMFSDFTNPSAEVDINNTLAPGFNWYCAGSTWPAIVGAWPTPIPPGTLTFSNSIMTVPAGGNPNPNVTSAAFVSAGKYVGNAFQPPHLLEWKGHFDYSIRNAQNSDELAWWMLPAEYIINPANFPYGFANIKQGAQEIDTVDSGVSGAFFNPLTAIFTNELAVDYQSFPFTGYVLWNSAFSYGINTVLAWNNQSYISLINSNVGNQPDLTVGTAWAVFTPTTPPNPTIANSNIIDFNQQHVWAFLRLEDRSKYPPFDDTGGTMNFFDGIYCVTPDSSFPSQHAYGSSVDPKAFQGDNMTQVYDYYHWVLIIGSGRFRNIYADYTKVTQ